MKTQQYARSSLQEFLVQRTTPQGVMRDFDEPRYEFELEDVSAHTRTWADLGWELVTVTTVALGRGDRGMQAVMHTFFWRHRGPAPGE